MADEAPDRYPQRALLPMQFDAARMRDEVHSLGLGEFVYYDVRPLRGPAHEIDPSIAPPPPADDYADGSWTDWLDTPAFARCAYLQQVIDTFRAHTTVNLVRVLRLAPRATVREHTDPTLALHIERSMVRLTIPIQRPVEVEFVLGGEPVPMQPGECWYLRLTDPHSIVNRSDEERISLTLDVIPNEWVYDLVAACA